MSKPTPQEPRVYLTDGHQRGTVFDVEDAMRHAREFDPADDVARLESFIEEADILLDGKPMPEINAKRLRRRLLNPEANIGRWEARHPGAQVPEDERRYLIPGLWPWGTIPLVTGQPKAGKTRMVCDLGASLAIPDRRFLDHFEPATLTEEERLTQGIAIINAETPPEDFERELLRLGVNSDPWTDNGQALVRPFHLEAEHRSFDLTNPEVFEEWLIELAQCDDCDGTDDAPPSVVILDGLTAVLQNAGKTAEHYGTWIAAFRKLLRALGTPNGLVVGHSTFNGGHSLGNTEGSAQSDGLWSYISTNPDKPTATRKFKAIPRMGGAAIPPTRVDLVDGRLMLASRSEKSEVKESSTEALQGRENRDYGTLLVSFVEQHHAETGNWPTTSELRGAKLPRDHFTKARDQVIEDGRLRKVKLSSHGGGAVFMIPEVDHEVEADPEIDSFS